MQKPTLTLAPNTHISNFENTPTRFLYQCLKTGVPKELMSWTSEEDHTFMIRDLEGIVELFDFIKRRPYTIDSESKFKRLLKYRCQVKELQRVGANQYKFIGVPEVQDLHIQQMISTEDS